MARSLRVIGMSAADRPQLRLTVTSPLASGSPDLADRVVHGERVKGFVEVPDHGTSSGSPTTDHRHIHVGLGFGG